MTKARYQNNRVTTHSDESTKQPRTNRRTQPPTQPRTHRHTHQAIHPPTMYYSSTAVTYSSRCGPSSYIQRSAPWSSGESPMGPGTCKTRQPPIPTNALAHTPAHTSTQPPTDAPTYPPTTCYSNTAVHTAGHALVHAEFIPVSCWYFHFLTILRHPGERVDPSPGGRLFKAPARRGGHRRPFFRRGHRGLLCGAGVEPPRGRGRPSRTRESHLFFGYCML